MIPRRASTGKGTREPRYVTCAQIGALVQKKPSARRRLLAELEANFGLVSSGQTSGKRYELGEFHAAMYAYRHQE